MFATSVRYKFKPGTVEKAVELWKKSVFEPGLEQEGVVALEFMTKDNDEALAVGIWQEEKYAQAFMKTGIFIDILATFEDLLIEMPQPERWNLSAFGAVK